jgi:hypothetical protein
MMSSSKTVDMSVERTKTMRKHTLQERSDPDDDLDSISKRCIQQSGERRAKSEGHLFSRVPEELVLQCPLAEKQSTGSSNTYLGQGHNGEEAECKPQACIPVEVVRDKAQGHEDEQNVEVGSKHNPSDGFGPRWFPLASLKECRHSVTKRLVILGPPIAQERDRF